MFDIDDTQWVEVSYSDHPIRPWCRQEFCRYCGKEATHKIQETTGPLNCHPMTAYVCCKDFFGYCSTKFSV